MSKPALLFDLDGTLIDSDPLHIEVFRDMFAARGIVVDATFYAAEIHGRQNAEIFAKHCPDEDPNALHVAKEAAFRAILGTTATPTPGAVKVIALAEALGWSMAVVTNAPRENANAMLGAIGLAEQLKTVVIGEECARGKPDPAPYLHALELLGATPWNSLAFEDIAPGVAAATGAGIRTVGLRSSLNDGELRTAGATLTISDFNDTALGPELARFEGEFT